MHARNPVVPLFFALALFLAAGVAAADGTDPLACRDGLVLHIGPLIQHLTCRPGWVPSEPPEVSIDGRRVRPWMPADRKSLTDVDGIDFPVFPRRLVIVTNAELVSASTMLQEFIDWRRSCGFEVVVGTEWAWNRPTEEDGDDRAARIRAWLKKEYAERGAGYLLLAGAPSSLNGGVPMRRVEPMAKMLMQIPSWLAAEMSNVPTDQYYADVESDWDCDEDGLFGEFPDDMGEGCSDWGPEFLTGRIPYYGQIAEFDRVLAATIAYEQAPDKTWRNRAIFAGAFGGFRGQASASGDGSVYPADDDLAGFLYRTAADLAPFPGLTPVRLFEDDGFVVSNLDHEGPLTFDGLLDEWLQGASTVGWGGHGSPTSTHRQVWLADADGDDLAGGDEVSAPAFADSSMSIDLESAPLAIVHMMSCLNGHSETPGNLGAALLGRGAIATASASRVAVGAGGADWEPMPQFAEATTNSYYFTRLVQAGHPVGDALAFTRWGLPGLSWSAYEQTAIQGGDAYSWLTKFEYNLNGDPTVSLERCTVDAECQDDLPCNGTEECRDGYCVHDDPVICEGDTDSLCTTRACDNATGKCEITARPDGIACEDPLFCTQDDVCIGGVCMPGAPRDCPYYTPDCDEIQDRCTYFGDDPVEEEADTGGCAASAPARFSPGLAALLLSLIARADANP
jgi:hypothetical protein